MPKPIRSILSPNNPLFSELITRASRITALNKLLQKHLPEILRPHCRAVSIKKGILMLEVNSNTWAAKLHFEKPALLHSLRQDPKFCGLVGIKHKINLQEPLTPTSKNLHPHPGLSCSSTRAIIETARYIDDKKLRISLQKLARNHGRR